jgi:tetratricopeptide (TPR) repeat protein
MKKPAFGIVGAPAETAIAPGGVRQPVDTRANGFVPREQLLTDRAGNEPALDASAEAARRGDWRAVAAALPPAGADPDRHYRALSGMAEVAVDDDAWLNAWLDASPDDANAWCAHAQATMRLAWRLRTGASAQDVLPEQWAGFRRVLGQAPAACERASTLAPDLATPWIVLMSCAQGLGWDHDRFREIWAEVAERAPHSVAAHQRALYYWLPRWQGSDELAAAFVADTLTRATPGRLLTAVRLEYLFLERTPDNSAYRGPEVAEALDAAIADLHAAPADHPYRTNHRHWLAYLLTKAGRYAEAVEEFRAVDGFVGARPWDLFADPTGTYAAARGEAVLGSGA